MYSKINGWGQGHEMMRFPKKPFHVLWKKGKVK
jgi:L-lactate dehydrogenase complex protein LldF